MDEVEGALLFYIAKAGDASNRSSIGTNQVVTCHLQHLRRVHRPHPAKHTCH